MDTFEIRQKYKYGTSLCFSIMDRKKFRISMREINVSSEAAGDASIDIMSRRKCSTVSGMENSKNTFLLGQAIPDYLLRRTSDIKYGAESPRYEFPCYSSFQDAILVKDVGVSCSLLNEDVIHCNTPISKVESYLIRQLKFEYNELSSITRKLHAYTKDILTNLAAKCKKNNQHVASKYILTPQRTEETENPCLKPRFYDNTLKKTCRSSKVDLNHHRFEKKIDNGRMHDTYFVIRDRNKMKRRVELDKMISKRVLEVSPKCSDGVLLRNYLIMRKEKVPGNILRMPLRKIENFVSSNAKYKTHNKSFYTSICDPSVLTNWREVSRQKDYKFKSAFTAGTSGKSRCAVTLDSYSV